MENPYSKMLETMRREGSTYNPPSIIIAVVTSPPPSLKIKFGDIEVDNDNILVADYLLKGYERRFHAPKENGKYGLPTRLSLDKDDGSFTGDVTGKTELNVPPPTLTVHTHPIDKQPISTWKTTQNLFSIDEGTMVTDCTLEVGDLVAVMPTADRQKYLVMARLVNVR